MKFGYIWPVVSEEKSFESVDGRRADDGGLPYYKLPRSLRLRGAKNDKISAAYANLSMIFYKRIRYKPFETKVEEGG